MGGLSTNSVLTKGYVAITNCKKYRVSHNKSLSFSRLFIVNIGHHESYIYVWQWKPNDFLERLKYNVCEKYFPEKKIIFCAVFLFTGWNNTIYEWNIVGGSMYT
jgi:hypothetical protein